LRLAVFFLYVSGSIFGLGLDSLATIIPKDLKTSQNVTMEEAYRSGSVCGFLARQFFFFVVWTASLI
jgi:hypothetical protein